MDNFFPSRSLLEVASWRLVAELVRRYPELRVIETHPGGGLYDCLQVLLESGRQPQASLFLNRAGSLRVQPLGSEDTRHWPSIWQDYLAADDPREVLDRVCDLAGLPPRHGMPATTANSVTYRFIAAFSASGVFGRDGWECRSGVEDTSGEVGGVRKAWFNKFPGALERCRASGTDDVLGEPAYRFWFLVDPEPRLWS